MSPGKTSLNELILNGSSINFSTNTATGAPIPDDTTHGHFARTMPGQSKNKPDPHGQGYYELLSEFMMRKFPKDPRAPSLVQARSGYYLSDTLLYETEFNAAKPSHLDITPLVGRLPNGAFVINLFNTCKKTAELIRFTNGHHELIINLEWGTQKGTSQYGGNDIVNLYLTEDTLKNINDKLQHRPNHLTLELMTNEPTRQYYLEGIHQQKQLQEKTRIKHALSLASRTTTPRDTVNTFTGLKRILTSMDSYINILEGI